MQNVSNVVKKRLREKEVLLKVQTMAKSSLSIGEVLNQLYSPGKVHQHLTRTSHTFRVYFKARRVPNSDTNRWVINWRIHINGQHSNFVSTRIYLTRELWDSKAQRIKGYSKKVDEQNKCLKNIENDLYTLFNDLQRQGVHVTACMLKDLYTSKPSSPMLLTSCYEEFIKFHSMKISKTTQNKFKYRLNVIREYLFQTNQSHIGLTEINAKWATNFYHYLLHERKVSLDRARSIIGSIAQVIDYAILQNELDANPLRSLRFARDKPKPIIFLREHELEQLQNCPFYSDKLQKVVDCFAFQSFTGLCYADLIAFDAKTNLSTDKDGQSWITLKRVKSQSICLIPLLEPAQRLLEKYNNRLPIITNQKMNDYIKEAAKLAGLERADEITTHVGRKTAACFFFNRGLPIETVSQVLGHRSIKITQMHYAELLTETIKKNFKKAGLL